LINQTVEPLVKLSDIVSHNPNEKVKRKSTYGIIIDATRPYKTETTKDYLTKIKIIDESFHPTGSQKKGTAGQREFIHLFIYTTTLEGAPNVTNIGDIIRLRRVDFEHFDNDTFREWQAQIPSGTPYKNWLIYSGRQDDSMDALSRRNAKITELSKPDRKRILELRSWGADFFSNHSGTSLEWGIRIVLEGFWKSSDGLGVVQN
jgi:Telomeric single stranded DNA binding POT1/CDC13